MVVGSPTTVHPQQTEEPAIFHQFLQFSRMTTTTNRISDRGNGLAKAIGLFFICCTIRSEFSRTCSGFARDSHPMMIGTRKRARVEESLWIGSWFANARETGIWKVTGEIAVKAGERTSP